MARQSRIDGFTALQERLIAEAGGLPNNGFLPSRIHTEGGTVYLKPMGTWVIARWEDPAKASSKFGFGMGAHGKFNFHGTDTAEGSLAFENFLRKISGRAAVAFNEPEVWQGEAHY